jgi:hypothetical protein
MKNSIKYGLIGGLSLGVLVFAGYYMAWYMVSFKLGWTILEFSILIFSIYLGVKEIRRTKYNNEITYRNAIWEGIKILFIITLIHSASIFIFFTTFKEKYIAYKNFTLESSVAGMKKAGYPANEINKYTKMVGEEFTPFILARYNVLYNLLLGLVFTLIIASILRKKDTIIVPEIKK